MSPHCPHCRSSRIILSQPRTSWERALFRLGMQALLCRSCSSRFFRLMLPARRRAMLERRALSIASQAAYSRIASYS